MDHIYKLCGFLPFKEPTSKTSYIRTIIMCLKLALLQYKPS